MITREQLADASRYITRRIPPQDRALIREALGLDAYLGNETAGHGVSRGRRGVYRTPDDIFATAHMPGLLDGTDAP